MFGEIHDYGMRHFERVSRYTVPIMYLFRDDFPYILLSHTIIICLFHYSASAAWLTGGQVDKIEVYENEGGVAHFRGGIRPCIIPAGYVGVSFWAGIFVAMSGSRVGATVSACIFLLALLVCLT